MELIFVYNADSGIFSALADVAHKAISPETYPCNLCKITFGAISEKEEWKKYIASLPHDSTFLHRDEFHAAYPSMRQVPLPAVFARTGDHLEVVVPAEVLHTAKTKEDLIALVSTLSTHTT